MKSFENTLIEISNNFINLSKNHSTEILEISDLIIASLNSGGKIMFCGNGGSAADSQHLSAELVGRYRKNRKAIASVSLTTDTSAITAIGNDFDFNNIFSRQIEAIGKSSDVLYALSTSGNSKNIINAINVAKSLGIKVIGVTGKDGGEMNNLCDKIIKVPSRRTDRIQEMHIAIGHLICEKIEDNIY
tara:strand:+ start:954 stop:1517 length:564 start_codon:yes stop_codon:yes gene_type:complete